MTELKHWKIGRSISVNEIYNVSLQVLEAHLGSLNCLGRYCNSEI